MGTLVFYLYKGEERSGFTTRQGFESRLSHLLAM